jgi:hypothetical protein
VNLPASFNNLQPVPDVKQQRSNPVFIYLLIDLFERVIDRCLFVTVFYFETAEAGPESLRAGGVFLLYIEL